MVLSEPANPLPLHNAADISEKSNKSGSSANGLFGSQIEGHDAEHHDRDVNEKADQREEAHVKPEHALGSGDQPGKGSQQGNHAKHADCATAPLEFVGDPPHE